MNEWAARFLSVFPERNKADLDEFIIEVTNDQAEHMYIQKEFDANSECRPTFEQVSQERIVEEMNRNIAVLKALENVVNERMLGFDAFHNNVAKTRTCFESFENCEGTMKLALDSLFVFTEQEMLQSRQHLFLGDLRRSLNEMKADALKRIADYLKEISAAEKEVTSAEKKLLRSKEQLERTLDYKAKMEAFEIDAIIRGVKKATSGGSSNNRDDDGAGSDRQTVGGRSDGKGSEHRYSERISISSTSSGTTSASSASNLNSNASGGNNASSASSHNHGHSHSSSTTNAGGGGANSSSNNNNSSDDSVSRCEKEIRDDIRNLLRSIEHRDQVLSASRRAFQKLDRECRQAAFYTLRKLAEKEKEHAELHTMVLAKLEASVNAIDIEDDMQQFITSRRSLDGSLQCSSQALSLLSDLNIPTNGSSASQRSPSRSSSASNSRQASRSNSFNNSPVSTSAPTAAVDTALAVTTSTLQHDYVDLKEAISTTSGDSAENRATPSTAALPHSETAPSNSKSKRPTSTRSSISSFFRGSSRSSGEGSKHKGAVPITSPSTAAAAAASSSSTAAASTALSTTHRASPPAPEAVTTGVADGNLIAAQTAPDSALERYPAVQYGQQLSQADFSAHLTKIFYAISQKQTTVAPIHATSKAVTTTAATAAISTGAVIKEESCDDDDDAGFLTCSSKGSRDSADGFDDALEDSAAANATAAAAVSKEKRSESRNQRRKHQNLLDKRIGASDEGGGSSSSGISGSGGNSNDIISSSGSGSGSASSHRQVTVRGAEVVRGKRPVESAHQWVRSNPSSQLVESVEWISKAVRTQAGRDAFITELNQFRSKKVDLGDGFDALGAVLWTTLNFCQTENDVRNAKVIMMLSQTFYQKIDRTTCTSSNHGGNGRGSNEESSSSSSRAVANRKQSPTGSVEIESTEEATDGAEEEEAVDDEESDDDDDSVGRRGVLYRMFIKERLMNHPIWRDPNYWEQALWQCAIDQLQIMPYENPWHELDRESRHSAVRRVHDVIFSQVMAITHSMMELGCSLVQCREFLYRMCVIHQLGEAQRQQLLVHITGKQ